MGKFFGTYVRTLDDKNRLQIPSKLVKEMPSRFFVLRGFDGCLAVYEEADFTSLLEKLSTLPYLDEKTRSYVRLLTSSVVELPVDAHGRVILSKDLIALYHIGSEVTIIGALDHFEVWDEEAYKKYCASQGLSFESLASSTLGH